MIDITGQRFGELVAIRRVGTATNSGRSPIWLCRCDCGALTEKQAGNMRRNRVKTCGSKSRHGRKYPMSERIRRNDLYKNSSPFTVKTLAHRMRVTAQEIQTDVANLVRDGSLVELGISKGVMSYKHPAASISRVIFRATPIYQYNEYAR